MEYWRVSSSSIRNVELALKSKTWGFSSLWARYCQRLRTGDKIVIYTSANHSFIVICEVTKEHFVDHSPIWLDDDYPHRIGIEPLPVSQKPLELKQARERAKRPRLAGTFISAIARLTPQDFDIILSMMTKK